MAFNSIREHVKDKLRRKFGIDFMRYPLYRILRDNDINLVLDVGANRGQFAMDLYNASYDGSIASYEPIPKVFEELQRNARPYSKWEVANAALGRSQCTQTIKVTSSDPSSSFYTVDEKYAKRYSGLLAQTQEIQVAVNTLDNVGAAYTSDRYRTFVKIDVQGAELDVIEGGTAFLCGCRGLQVEVSLQPVYRGSPVLEDVIARLRTMHFVPIHIRPGFKDPDTWHSYDCDLIFLNSRYL